VKDRHPELFLASAAPEEQIDNRVIFGHDLITPPRGLGLLKTGALPRHEVSFMVYTNTGFVRPAMAVGVAEKEGGTKR
jgi:hypothetical protein